MINSVSKFNSNKTIHINRQEQNKLKKEYFVIADGICFGRLLSAISVVVQGKNVLSFSYHNPVCNKINIINLNNLLFTGNKIDKKIYFTHSRYTGSLKKIVGIDIKNLMAMEKMFIKSLNNMLPKNNIFRSSAKLLSFSYENNLDILLSHKFIKIYDIKFFYK